MSWRIWAGYGLVVLVVTTRALEAFAGIQIPLLSEVPLYGLVQVQIALAAFGVILALSGLSAKQARIELVVWLGFGVVGGVFAILIETWRMATGAEHYDATHIMLSLGTELDAPGTALTAAAIGQLMARRGVQTKGSDLTIFSAAFLVVVAGIILHLSHPDKSWSWAVDVHFWVFAASVIAAGFCTYWSAALPPDPPPSEATGGPAGA